VNHGLLQEVGALEIIVAADIEANVFGDSKRVQAEYGLREEFKAYTGY
jgi:hypothetical protein